MKDEHRRLMQQLDETGAVVVFLDQKQQVVAVLPVGHWAPWKASGMVMATPDWTNHDFHGVDADEAVVQPGTEDEPARLIFQQAGRPVAVAASVFSAYTGNTWHAYLDAVQRWKEERRKRPELDQEFLAWLQ